MIEREFDAVIDAIPEVTEFIEAALEEAECPMRAVMQINVAIDEIFNNIASYAYADGKGKAKIALDINDDPRAVIITFTDSGVPYNPLEKDDPDITLSAEERGIGGLGIFMVKKTMDNVEYEYKNGCNVLTITKNI